MRRWLVACDAWLFGGAWQRASFTLALLLLGGMAFALIIAPLSDDLEVARDLEPRLKQDYRDKLRQAVNLPLLRQYKLTIGDVATREQRKSSFVEVTSLAHRFGLQVDQFDAEETTLTVEPLVTRSATVRLEGSYRQLAEFAEAMVADGQRYALRGQVWDALRGAPGLSLEATIDIYRPMTDEELAEERKAKAKAKEAAKR